MARFKTDYRDEVDLFPTLGGKLSYGGLLIVLLAVPMLCSVYYVGEIGMLFVWSIGAVGTMILIGYSGLISLAQAAFLALGAYTYAILMNAGMPFVVAFIAAGAFSGLVGLILSLPVLRLSGIYLAFATLALGAIVEQILLRWTSLTGGMRGMMVPPATLLGLNLSNGIHFYYFAFAILAVVLFLVVNLLRSPTGRAWMASRDSGIAARSIGIHVYFYRVLAFVVSATIMGIAGALYANKATYLTPDMFTFLMSVQFLVMVVVGGLASLQGAILGAIFVTLLPIAISLSRDYLPNDTTQVAGLQPGIFGVLLVLVLLFEPQGIYGGWVKWRDYFVRFPLNQPQAYQEQRQYLRSERDK